jgi:hypothetical protein
VISEMAETRAWELFKDRAQVEIISHQKRILAGRLSEEQYRREAGWVDGALAILSLPTQINAEYMRERERFEEAKTIGRDEQ